MPVFRNVYTDHHGTLSNIQLHKHYNAKNIHQRYNIDLCYINPFDTIHVRHGATPDTSEGSGDLPEVFLAFIYSFRKITKMLNFYKNDLFCALPLNRD